MIFASTFLSAQTIEDREKVKKEFLDEIDQELFKSLIGNQFTRILTGYSLIPGNYAALDVKDAQLTGSGFVSTGSNSLLTFRLSGGVTEGVASLFSDSKANPNVGVELKHNFLNPRGIKSIVTSNESHSALEKKIQMWYDYYETEKKAIETVRLSDSLLNELYTDSLLTIEQSIEDLKKKAGSDTSKVMRQKSRVALAKVYETQIKLQHTKDSLEVQSKYRPDYLDLTRIRNQRIRTEIKQLRAIGCNIGWFSVGYKLLNRNFFLFDSAAAYASQVERKDFTAHQLSIEYNHYYRNAGNFSWFIGGGIAFLLDDTFAQLNKTEVSDTYTYAGSPKARTEQKKYTAFRGDYRKDIRFMRPFMEVYYFLSRPGNVALHLYPEIQFSRESKPLTNIGTGLLITFNDRNDKNGKALINAELYMQFRDVANNLEKKNYHFYERNDIGIRLSFPLNFN